MPGPTSLNLPQNVLPNLWSSARAIFGFGALLTSKKAEMMQGLKMSVRGSVRQAPHAMRRVSILRNMQSLGFSDPSKLLREYNMQVPKADRWDAIYKVSHTGGASSHKAKVQIWFLACWSPSQSIAWHASSHCKVSGHMHIEIGFASMPCCCPVVVPKSECSLYLMHPKPQEQLTGGTAATVQLILERMPTELIKVVTDHVSRYSWAKCMFAEDTLASKKIQDAMRPLTPLSSGVSILCFSVTHGEHPMR